MLYGYIFLKPKTPNTQNYNWGINFIIPPAFGWFWRECFFFHRFLKPCANNLNIRPVFWYYLGQRETQGNPLI
jgi:hypothetical protein